MKKKLILTGAVALGISLMSLFAIVPMNAVNKSDLTNWMSRVDDSYLIRKMSIPGTHDSGATHSLVDLAGKCQDLSIQEHLDIGVRFFDIRLQLKNDKFVICHDFLDQKLDFEPVLKTFDTFLDENKDEFLLVSLKKDYDTVNSSKDFDVLLKEYLSTYTDKVSSDSNIPNTLGEARGNIYIIDRYGFDMGVPAYYWSDNTTFETNELYVQDYYCIDKVEDKIAAIDGAINYSKNNNSKLTINFASCYIDNDFPPSYAGKAAKEINNHYINVFKNDASRLGVMLFDYISSDITSLMIGGNK